jgi:MFS family permease
MLPMAAFLIPCARFAPALVARLSARTVCTAGLVLIAGGLVVLAQLTAASGYWLLVVGLIPLGAGMGLATTPATSGITSALPAAKQGVGSAINDLSRETGGAVGIAVLASVLTATYQSHLSLAHVPAAEVGRPGHRSRSPPAWAEPSPRTPRRPSLTGCISPCSSRPEWSPRPPSPSPCSCAKPCPVD